MSLDTRTWPDEGTHISENVAILYERFVLGSLAISVSHRAQGFIDELNIVNSAVAEAWRQNTIPFAIFKDKTAEVEQWISDRLSEGLWEGEEYYVCVRTDDSEVKKRIEELDEYRNVEKNPLHKDANSFVKRRFFEVDSLYRHLRNALAHGCFREVDSGDQPSLFFFDINNHANVSAVGFLRFDTLNSWYQRACDLAHRRL